MSTRRIATLAEGERIDLDVYGPGTVAKVTRYQSPASRPNAEGRPLVDVRVKLDRPLVGNSTGYVTLTAYRPGTSVRAATPEAS